MAFISSFARAAACGHARCAGCRGAIIPVEERPAAAGHSHRRGRRDPRPHQCALEGSGGDTRLPAPSRLPRYQPAPAAGARVAGYTFANDHLDAFFNATVDAAIALEAFVATAEAAGLGCYPISVIRNHAEEVSGLLGSAGPCVPGGGSRRRHTGHAGVCLGEATARPHGASRPLHRCGGREGARLRQAA